MSTQILEGTFTEVQERLSQLPIKPESHLRIVITEQESLDANMVMPFIPTTFRNGVPLLPQRKLSEPITLDLINRLAEDA
jgi:hypothetical protein